MKSFILSILLYFILVYLIHNIHKHSAGYFKTMIFNAHMDQTYGKRNTSRDNITSEMHALLRTLMALCESIQVKPVLMYGGLLGWRHHQKQVLPWDDDLDLIVLGNDVDRIVTLDGLETDHWIFRVNPRYKNRIIHDPFNKIDARLISKRNGVFIDLTFFWQTHHNTLIAKDGNEYNTNDMLPLKADTFEGIPVFVPNNVDAVLVKRYGLNALKPYEWHLQQFGSNIFTIERIKYSLKNISRYLIHYLFLFPIIWYIIIKTNTVSKIETQLHKR